MPQSSFALPPVTVDPSRSNEHRISLVLSLSQLRLSLADHLRVLQPYGYDLNHLVGFAVYVLGERRGSLAEQNFGHVTHPQASAQTYLAHELLSVNPYIGSDPAEFQKILGTTHGAIEIIIRVIRGLVLNATRNPHTYSLLLERFVGTNAALLSVRVIEAPHASYPLHAAPVL